MFWLEKFIGGGSRRIFDLGDHIGVSYYAYRRHMVYPDELRWTVYDVPAVVARGQLLSEKLDDAGQLHFTDQFEECRSADVIMAIGSLQYLPETLVEGLGYKLVDRWENVEKSCTIPFRSQHSLDRYYGFYFSRVEDA